jgi:hypothetical protein
MATWITHLRVAEKLSKSLRIPSLGYYLLGNIAPDSGILAADGLTYSPPATISHFENKNLGKWKSQDLLFYKNYIRENKPIDIDKYSFYLGYFSHLVLDVLWGYFIYYPIKNEYINEFKDKHFIWKIKEDWYGIDFEFLQKNTCWKTWDLFKSSKYEINALDYYPPENIRHKLTEIIELYSNSCPFKMTGLYLKFEDVDKFITISVPLIIEALKTLETLEDLKYNSIFEYLEFKNEILKKDYISIRDV